MGILYVLPDGDDCTLAQMEARGAYEAMKLGATSMKIEYDQGKFLEGTKYGIDFGTAASISVNSSGSAVLAPGSTLGWSKAKSNNEFRSALVIELFHDATLIVE